MVFVRLAVRGRFLRNSTVRLVLYRMSSRPTNTSGRSRSLRRVRSSITPILSSLSCESSSLKRVGIIRSSVIEGGYPSCYVELELCSVRAPLHCTVQFSRSRVFVPVMLHIPDNGYIRPGSQSRTLSAAYLVRKTFIHPAHIHFV